MIQTEGNLDSNEMYRVFNMGLGMVAVCSENQVSAFIEKVPDAVVAGRVVERGQDEQVIILAT